MNASTSTSTSTKADHTCAAVQVGPAVYSVKTFCDAHDITKVTFYKLLKDGTAPRIMKVGARTLISLEAAADWRRQMEEGAHVMPSRRSASR